MLETVEAVRIIPNKFLNYTKSQPWLNLRGRLAFLGLIFIIAASLVGPLLIPYGPLEQNITHRLQNPSFDHLFGTDQFGRDLLVRLLAGGQLSLLGAVVVCVGTNLLGFLVGVLAGSCGRFVDGLVNRLIEAFQAIPAIVAALALSAVLGREFHNLLLAIILTNWPWYARTYRALILKEKVALYVEGAKALGATPFRQLRCHILPNILGPVIVIATLNFGAVILNLSALSFIGLGMQPPTPEWGMLINEARPYFQHHPWQMLAPGLGIAATVLCVNMLGDALRDWLDPYKVRTLDRTNP